MGLLKNTLTNYTRRTVDTYSVAEYNSTNLPAIVKYITTLPSNMYTWYNVQDNDKFERISQELYNNPDYWDVLLILNSRTPLLGLPFDYDTLIKLSADFVLEYELFSYGRTIPDKARTIMMDTILAEKNVINESNRVLKIIKPTEMNKFLQTGYDLGLF